MYVIIVIIVILSCIIVISEFPLSHSPTLPCSYNISHMHQCMVLEATLRSYICLVINVICRAGLSAVFK